MPTIQEAIDKLNATVTKDTDVESSAVALIQGLADQIRALPASATAISDLADKVQANADALAAAVAANTNP